MGGVCSRKRNQLVDEGDSFDTSPRFSKTSSLKWFLLSLPWTNSDVSRKGQGEGPGRCPSLMELCVARVCKDIDMYSSFMMLPTDLSQQIFNKLVESKCLTEASLQTFRDCALQDICLGEYPGVKDAWMEVVASQRKLLLSVDISCSEVTDGGIDLRDCSSIQSLACNYYDQISEYGLGMLLGQTPVGFFIYLNDFRPLQMVLRMNLKMLLMHFYQVGSLNEVLSLFCS